MKRKKLVMGLILIAAVVAGVLALTGCQPDNPDAESYSNYRIGLELSDDLETVKVSETVVYRHKAEVAIDQLVFRLYANAYAEGAAYPAYLNALGKYGGFELQTLTCDGSPVTPVYGEDRTVLRVPLSRKLATGDTVTIAVEGEVTVPHCNLRLGLTDGVLNFGNAIPVLSVFRDGQWREDRYTQIGDPFVAETAEFEVTVTAPASLKLATGGNKATVSTDGNKNVFVIPKHIARDFTLAASYDFAVNERDVDGVTVRYFYRPDKQTEADAMLNTAVSALEWMQSTAGDYPYDNYAVCETPFYYGGMEYGGLVLINDASVGKDDIVIHETVHQWFGVGVGSDAVNESWVDEALTTFLSHYYYKGNGNVDRFESGIANERRQFDGFMKARLLTHPGYRAEIDRNLYAFETIYEYSLVVYSRGALMFDAAYRLMGERKFEQALRAYYQAYSNRIADAEGLFAAFDGAMRGISETMRPWLKGAVVQESFLPRASV
ncbi:MAG TPA: M1 family metallopeptidase [Candidatus Stercoripulliclostridium merdipullorum]|uniref:M1 family metallopeptidase n=1 Tax=Candidatus Stercoripulliclostridium merdipullorum TaxID=2840952 RepID=A0A9D1SY38_9FIRM|nr:M1 family metallopeptidase [Candidatus Stercoripulliclostridium merdipullorum]